MKIADIPVKFPVIWGADAGGSYIRAIPEASQIGIQDGAASLETGFPPLNFIPRGAGGVPPFGEDANGILNQITAWSQWFNAGAPVPYDATFQTAIGGYPKGAVVASTKIIGLTWRSTVDDNATNPDAAGAGWAVGSRATLVDNTTFYVAVTGSDSTGDGSSGTPWRTAQHASDVLHQQYDLAGFVATIMRAASTAYTDTVLVKGPYVGAIGPQSVVFDGSGMASVTVTSAVNFVALYQAQGGAQFTVQNQRLVQSGSNTAAITCFDFGSYIAYGAVDFGPANAASNHMSCTGGGTVNAISNYTISGGGTAHMGMGGQGLWGLPAITVTITGTPAWGNAFVYCRQNSTVVSGSTTFTGSATGTRYSASGNGVIDTTSGGANYFPGNVAGNTGTGGQYI